MRRRSLLILGLACHLASSATPADDDPPAEYACRPMGSCNPCPSDQLDSPACRRFGNRRLIHCVYLGTTSPARAAAVLRGGGVHPVAVASGPDGVVPRRRRHRRMVSTVLEERQDERPADVGGEEQKPEEAPTDHEEDTDPAEGDQEEAVPRTVDQENDIGTAQGGAGFPTWEACERVVARERADFFEFVLCNLFFALAALGVFLIRHRKLAARQYGRLAARIGIPLAFVGGAGGQSSGS